MFESIKLPLDKKKGIESLIKQAKEGKITREDRTSAKLIVYEAFKPIMDSKNINRKAYLENTKLENQLRMSYLSIMLNYAKHEDIYKTELPELYNKNLGFSIDVSYFTDLLRDINQDWVMMHDNIKENTREQQRLAKLSQLSYTSFIKAKPSTRKKFVRVSHDHNRTEDIKVYTNLQGYIEEKEHITIEEFLDSPELREKYRKEYHTLQDSIKSSPRAEFATAEEAIKRTVGQWKSQVLMEGLISEESKEKFMQKYDITTFAQMSEQDANDLYAQSSQNHQKQIMQQQQLQQKQIEELNRKNTAFQDQINEQYNNFFSSYIAETKANAPSNQELEDMFQESSKKTAQAKGTKK